LLFYIPVDCAESSCARVTVEGKRRTVYVRYPGVADIQSGVAQYYPWLVY